VADKHGIIVGSAGFASMVVSIVGNSRHLDATPTVVMFASGSSVFFAISVLTLTDSMLCHEHAVEISREHREVMDAGDLYASSGGPIFL